MFDIRKIQEKTIYNAVKNKSNDQVASKVVYGENNQLKKEENCNWVKSIVNLLEDNFDKDTIKEIRMNCQCGYGMEEKLDLLKELIDESSNLAEFTNSKKAKSVGLFSKDNKLYLKFLFCPCPMLSEVDKLDSYTWCQCTTGYSKVLFEKAFNCEMNVNLLKSVKAGDDICLMEIIPCKGSWDEIL